MPTQPNPIAVAAIQAKTPVGSPLNSEGWSRVPLALRESAQFSATVESYRLLQRIQNRVETAIKVVRREGEGRDGGPGAYQTKQKFVAEMQKIAREEGLDPRNRNRPDLAGGIQDVTSVRRLGLIFDVQTEKVQEFAKWKMDQDPDVLNAYPAQELIRVSARKTQRNWLRRWAAAGGRLRKGRMVALKTDPIWKKLSRFGTPWPPFDYGSGMGLRDLSRRDAIALGLMKQGERIEPIEADFNQSLEASVKDLNPKMQSALQRSFGDQVEIKDGVARWQGNVIQELAQKAIDDPQPKGELQLGLATPSAIEKAAVIGYDLDGYNLTLLAPELRHIIKRHGEPNVIAPGSGETDPRQSPITMLDLQAVPFIWRAPESVRTGETETDLVFTKNLSGELYAAAWTRSPKNKLLLLKSLRKTKKAPGA